MIDCKFDFVEFRLSVTGHAGAEKNLQDHDLVCCAASTITQQLLHSLELLQEEKGALYDLESNLAEGKMIMHVRPKEFARASVRRRFEYCREGLEMLEERYPDNIRVTEVWTNGDT